MCSSDLVTNAKVICRRAVEYRECCTAVGVLPAKWHRLILGQRLSQKLKGLISRLARLSKATLSDKGVDMLVLLNEVVLATTLKLEGLVGGGVKYWVHYDLFF